MASELMDKQIENLIRRLGLLKMQGELDGKFHDWEIEKIIEALQAMEDLETIAAGKNDCSIVVEKINTKDGTVFAVGKGQGSCAGWFASIPEALRAAAEAIEKGGTE